MKKKLELWVACMLYGEHKSKPNNPVNQHPVGNFEGGNTIAKKPAYTSKKAIYGAARYCGYDKPSYEDENVIVYKSEGYYSKQIEYHIFYRKIIVIDISGIGFFNKL